MAAYGIMAAWYFTLILSTAGNLPGALVAAGIILLSGGATATYSREERGWMNERQGDSEGLGMVRYQRFADLCLRDVLLCDFLRR